MTVSTEISSNEYTGNGVTTDFDYKFRIFKANQLSVITSDADGDNVVTLRLGTDYTVTGANKSAGGKVILAKPLADGHKISIARDIPIKQETSFRNQSKFFAETHEDAFDYLTMILQRIWGSLGSLYLKRPNILANWFDAKGYRIANLGKPKRDSDAVDLGTLKDEIEGVNSTILKREKRLLRVDDMDIPALPKANERAGNVLTFDKDGKPIVVAPASGSVVDVLNQLGNGNGSLIGTEYGKTLDEVIFGRIYEGGDAAEKVREVLSRGYSPMFMNGVHKFKTTVQDGDGNDCFALVPSNTTIYTESKGVVLRPEVSANSFFSSIDVIATDIYVQSCTAFGVAEGTTSPRLVSCFFPARGGDEGRIVRFNISEVNLVDFDKGYDAYTWSSYLTNTDVGWCEAGYNFREGARAPTSLRLIGTGATSCSTAYNIERTTYSIMINAFADDADVGIKIGEAKGLSIIQPGFEYCKQFAIIGTDHWESTSTGINWQGAFCWQRVRKGKTDSVENYADWAVEVYRTFDSTFDFSGIDNDWVKRNAINFIKLKSCFGIHIDGIPPESIYVDPTGDSTYEDISLGDKCRNRVLNFYVNAVTGDDRKNGSETTPFASFSKVNFVLPNDMKGRRKVLITGDVADRLVIKNKKSSLYDKSSSVNTLQIEGDGGIVNGISIFNVNMGDAGLLIKNISTTSNSYIESSTGFNIDTLKLKAGARLYITSSSGYIGNLTMETGAEVICQKGAQLKVGAVTGGKITSNSSIVYRDRSLDSVQLVQSAGGQFF
ncbi:hypothetical protein AB7Y07_00735 [Providencia rettgeri]